MRPINSPTLRRQAAATTLAVAALGLAALPSASAAPASSCSSGTCTVSFAVTGAPETWTVPAGVTTLNVTLAGASGGVGAILGHLGGTGGEATATVTVTPGEVLGVVVGDIGTNGRALDSDESVFSPGGYGGGGTGTPGEVTSGAGGGGGTFLARLDGAQTTFLLVAGGGGGGNGCAAGGAGGAAAAGGDGGSILDGLDAGHGATLTAGGGGGGNFASGRAGTGPASDLGHVGDGGEGFTYPDDPNVGGGSGGGGGMYGGGGGGDGTTPDGLSCFGSGGGGSGFVGDGVTVTSRSNNTGPGSLTLSYSVAASTTTTLASSTNPAVVGAAVTYKASVSPAPEGGTVTFFDGSSTIGGCAAVPVVAGTATCSTTYNAVGSHQVTAAYSGDAVDKPSASAVLHQDVAYGQQVITLSASGSRGGIVAVVMRLTDASGHNVSAKTVAVHAVAIDGGPLGSVVTQGGSNFPYVAAVKSYSFLAVQKSGLAKGQHVLTFTAGADPTTHGVRFTTR
jgi:Bacterial Ig-like domain (group 3)/Glycine rich protein